MGINKATKAQSLTSINDVGRQMVNQAIRIPKPISCRLSITRQGDVLLPVPTYLLAFYSLIHQAEHGEDAPHTRFILRMQRSAFGFRIICIPSHPGTETDVLPPVGRPHEVGSNHKENGVRLRCEY